MSFSKAVIRTQIPEYTEYCAAMLVYKKNCSAHQMFMRKMRYLEHSTNVLERAQFYDEENDSLKSV